MDTPRDAAAASLTVLVPTFRRPQSLERALRSVFAQTLFAAQDAPEAEIVVVDNAPEASARAVVEALRPDCPVPLLYVHEPRPGVATARNTGLAAASGALIAFLDDDEAAPPTWLDALRSTHLAFEADVTFGPVRGVADGARPQARAYLDGFFSRTGPPTSGPIVETFGCGASMMTRATTLPGAHPFDTAADHTGGEDDRLFTSLKARRARFAWAAEAWVVEYAPPHRSTVRYALTRAFGYGQSPSQGCARDRDPLGVGYWMAVGAGQAAVYGLGAAAMWIARRPSRYALADRAARGLGKVFWPGFLEFYGAAEARRTARRASRPASGRRGGQASRTARAVNMTQTRSL